MKQFVIIGNSAAGLSALEAIRRKDKTSKIVVVSDEDYPAYCRCLISYFLSADVGKEKLFLKPENFYQENNIELLLNKKVASVSPKKNRVTCEDKTQLSYDALLIATGASPKFPEIKGIKREGVFGFRTLKDIKAISELLAITKTACVLGGGLVGLKAAYALKKRGCEVKVIIKSRQVLSQMLDRDAASFVQKKLEEHGIEFILGQDVLEIIGEGDVRAVKLDSGKVLGCSLVIVGKGVSPNIDLVKDTEIKVNEGIISSPLMQANIDNIYTAGDVCEAFDLTLGKTAINALWPVAVEQGRVAGLNMAGEKTNYGGSLGMNSIEFFGFPTVSLGIYKLRDDDKGFEELKFYDKKENIYKKIILKDNFVVGAVFSGDIKNSGLFLRLIREKIDVSTFKGKLLQENFGYPDILDFIKEEDEVYIK